MADPVVDSKVLYLQRIGRGARIFGEKRSFHIVEIESMEDVIETRLSATKRAREGIIAEMKSRPYDTSIKMRVPRTRLSRKIDGIVAGALVRRAREAISQMGDKPAGTAGDALFAISRSVPRESIDWTEIKSEEMIQEILRNPDAAEEIVLRHKKR
jgi:superfamily II DNA or RNA helicase